MHAGKLDTRNPGIAWRLGAAAIEHGVVLGQQRLDLDVDADIDPALKAHALALHLFDAAVDKILLHLEVGNAVA